MRRHNAALQLFVSYGWNYNMCSDGFNIIDALFESASAVCTVGRYSWNNSSYRCDFENCSYSAYAVWKSWRSHSDFATVSSKRKDVAKFPEEKIMVG